MTDGHENSSGEYSYDQIKKLIKEKENADNWEFLFIGSDLNDFSDADNLGLNTKASTNKENTVETYNSLSKYTTMYRTTNMDVNDRINHSFNQKEEENID